MIYSCLPNIVSDLQNKFALSPEVDITSIYTDEDELLGLDTQEKIREVATITQKMQKK
jgi:hypothetical protein